MQATAAHADIDTSTLFDAARRRHVTNPDWSTNARPYGCRLTPPADHATLLRGRAAGTTLEPQPTTIKVTAPSGAAIVTWADTAYQTHRSTDDVTDVPYPATSAGPNASTGAAVFTRRGDALATGWLATYRQYADQQP